MKIDPLEYDKLGFIWRGNLFLFVGFVWGCRHAGYCWQWLTSAVAFIFRHLGVEKCGDLFYVLNYCDDFAGAESEKSVAEISFATMSQLLSELGLTEALTKANPPSTRMVYLGVGFDTEKMCIFVDSDKLTELKGEIFRWVRKTTAKKFELQSILGKLLWVSKAVRHSRIFVSRIIAETRKLSKQSEKTILSREIMKDFLWWQKFIEVFNGVELIPPITVSLAVYGDACPQSGGSRNQVRGKYFALKFPYYLCSPDIPIHVKEFIVVILSIRLWGQTFTGQRIIIYCDNDAVCDAIFHQKPKDSNMQQLLREFLFWVCCYNFTPLVEKIGTKENFVADFLSRNTNQSDIESYFHTLGFPKQTNLSVPESWFEFHADW